MNKIGNVNVVGNIQLNENVYTVEDLIEKLENTNTSGGNAGIENVPELPTGSDIDASKIYIVGNTINFHNGSNWVTLQDSDGNKSIDTILFKAPELSEVSQYAHFKIEFSDSDTFETITYTLNTSDPSTYTSTAETDTNSTIDGLKVFTGMSMVGFPVEGLSFIFSKEIVKLNITNITGNFYRFQWLIGDSSIENDILNASRYGFGQISGIIAVFDDI
jgi:hypothetical protein